MVVGWKAVTVKWLPPGWQGEGEKKKKARKRLASYLVACTAVVDDNVCNCHHAVLVHCLNERPQLRLGPVRRVQLVEVAR
eukprot:69126-Chlamydomonas_euryale.AAC.1